MADLSAYSRDHDFERIGIDVCVALVDPLDQFRAFDDDFLAEGQEEKDAPLERREAKRQTVELKRPELGVEGERSADDAGIGMAGGAADQGAQSHDQFLDAERLGQIVVGAGLEPIDSSPASHRAPSR